MTSIGDIRSTFIDYFKRAGHSVVDASPLVPRNDPTLLFTNSGMVQFKNVFTGAETRPYVRAVSAQKCIRVGGKHNDLDNVGFTARHHTFFEMLGNFSFGDYFKEFAIEHAWDLLVRTFGLPVNRLLVTIYADDDDAFELWRKISGLPESKIIRIPTADNFWRMGDLGPCGPSSEIFFDHGDRIAGGPPGSAEQDGDRFVEVWNLVFMQYDQKTLDTMVPLPKSCIDTGMGIERLAAILQGKHDNYDTDLLRTLILASSDLTGVDPDGPLKASHRVVADHLRSGAFLIADGVTPSNEGRGYVLRRILRRAMRHVHLLGVKEPLMHLLVPTLVGLMGNHYKELIRSRQLIAETLLLEETSFRKMLDRGLALLDEETRHLVPGQALAGEVAFRLYDTFGFPVDLMQDALRSRQITVDIGGFDNAMAQQKYKAREAWRGSGDQATDQVWFDVKEKAGVSEFLGYETESAEGEVVAIVSGGQIVDAAKKGDTVALVVNQTPFYAEGGGQVGDTGMIRTFAGLEMSVDDTQKKLDALPAHIGRILEGGVKTGDIVSLQVDVERRADIRANHSATHLMHAALRKRLGTSVTQRGSQVRPDGLRFDISYPRALTSEDIAIVEQEVNRQIRLNEEVATRIMSADEAQQVNAMALFGEKYDDEVRVLFMGTKDEADNAYSVELCGGTHVRRIGSIGLFKIVRESAIGANLRRIEAVTGRGALAYIEHNDQLLSKVGELLSANRGDLLSRVTRVIEDQRKAERDLQALRRQVATGGPTDLAPVLRTAGGVKIIGRLVNGVSAKDLPSISDEFLKHVGSGVIVLATVNSGRAALLVRVTKDLLGELDAVQLIKSAVGLLGGTGGGGRPDLAQAGGPNGGAANEAIEAVVRAVANTSA
jgi:alanyl-tRNA synthetase